MKNKIFIIAEIAQAHDGSLGLLHSYIDALAETGVDAVKFQTHIAEAESSEFEQFRVPFSYVDKTRYDYWKRMEFTPEQWEGIKEHCERKGLEFISSPFSIAAVELLEKLNVKRYKIGSGEVSNTLLLDRIAQTKKPTILSSGMSDYAELDQAVTSFQKQNIEYSILQCTTAYPTVPAQWGLSEITAFKKRYQVPIGFSDHSGDIFACLAATSLGAEILEFHAVFDRRMFGPDAKASLEINEIKTLVKGVHQIRESLQTQVEKNDIEKYKELKTMFGKSLCLNKNIQAGDIIRIQDLESKKPGNKGIPASRYQEILGKKTKVDLKQWDFVNFEQLEI